MSKHRFSSEKCCYNPMMYGHSGYGMQGYGGGQGGSSCGSDYGGWGIRWIYALLILIVVVLQFSKKNVPAVAATTHCGCETVAVANCASDNQLIDNSVLFIIVVFLLILCSGCWGGGQSNYGAAGFGYTGGYGY